MEGITPMLQPHTGHDSERARAFWTGLDPHDLHATLRAPLDGAAGFALPERVVDTGAAPVAQVFAAIAAALADTGARVGPDGALDADALRTVARSLGAPPDAVTSEADLMIISDVRVAAEAAGLIARRSGRAHLTPSGRAAAREETLDTVVPHLLRGWARRPIPPSNRVSDAIHASWPLTVLLLHRFGARWLPLRLYAKAVAEMTPEALRAAEREQPDAAIDTFAETYVGRHLIRFAAAFGIAEVSLGDDEDDDGDEPAIRSTPLLDALLPLVVDQADPSHAFDDWDGDAPPSVNEELAAALSEREFTSEDELQAFVEDFTNRRNTAPVDDFDGLSPEQMQRLLWSPLEPGSPIAVSQVPRVTPPSPLLFLVLDLAQALGDAGLKATAKGNLPRTYVHEAAARYRDAGWVRSDLDVPERARGEEDVGDLHVARIVARMAGLITLRSGRWRLTKRYRDTMARHGALGVYGALFEAFVRKYAWNYADLYPEFDIVQRSWGFSLLLLLRYGGEWRPPEFYADRFLRAFPLALDEAEDAYADHPWMRDPADAVRDAYTVRALERFAAFLGLVEVERGRYGRLGRLRATPALAEVVARV
ncbi:MAG: hypothetical protein EA416_16710 [Trueperaceae bacterium]|nr:MAG: hypothetical protein EA416_16710 [Trueperaceae bacterium]